MTDEQYEALWDSLWGYHGREPMKLSHLEFARAIESAACAPLTKQMQRLSMEELEAIFQCGGDVYTNVQSALAAKNGMELVGAPEEKGGE